MQAARSLSAWLLEAAGGSGRLLFTFESACRHTEKMHVWIRVLYFKRKTSLFRVNCLVANLPPLCQQICEGHPRRTQ